MLMRRFLMWIFQVSFSTNMIPRCFVLLFIGMGIFLQAKVASMMLKGLREKTTVNDFEVAY